MAGDGEDTLTIRHDDMFTLPQNAEATLFKGTYGVEMMDPSKFPHVLTDCNFDFAYVPAACQFLDRI